MAFDPSNFIPVLGRRYPWIYSRLDSLRRDEQFSSLDAVERLLVETYGVELSCAGSLAPAVCACSAWGVFRRTYSYHETLAGFLVAAAEGLDMDSSLPLDSLLYLPVPCAYIQAPGIIAESVDGFYAWMEQKDGVDPVYRFVFVIADGAFCPSSYIRLTPEASLGGCLPDAMAVTAPAVLAAAQGNDAALALLSGVPAVPGKLGNVIHNLTVRAVQLLLYLVSIDADIEVPQERAEGGSPAPAGEGTPPVIVGSKAGERLRHIAAQKKVHIRQGHWHKYWVGPRNGDRRQVAKWIEPVVVGEGRLKASTVVVTGDADG